MGKLYFLIFIILTLFFAVGVFYFCRQFFVAYENAIESKIQADYLKTQLTIAKIKKEKPITLLFVGDMMFDRGIEYQMKKNSVLYPFEKIENVLKGVDYVIGNLEGPIVEHPIDYGKTSLTFNFDKFTIDGLKYGHFNILSLANNHILNADAAGLEKTKEILEEAGINYFGDPVGCDEKDIFSDDKFVFIGINQTYNFNCSKEKLSKFVKNLKEKNPGKIIIVFLHWGVEYQTKANKFQKDLAYSLVDSGVDLIVGSHPHVVQEVEEYGGGYIAYSLGNFIFDQNFSEETEEGLMLKVLVEDKKIVEVEPIKIKFTKSFQPELVND